MKTKSIRFIGLTGWGLIAVAVLLFSIGIIGGFKLNWAIGAGMYIMLVGSSFCAVCSFILGSEKKQGI